MLQGYVTVTETDTTLRLSNYMLAMQIHEPSNRLGYATVTDSCKFPTDIIIIIIIIITS